MSPKRKQRYLYIDGKAIPVTEKVYRAFWHYEDKEDYFMRLLKSPRQIRDKDTQEVIVVPAREIPMEQIPAWLQSSTKAAQLPGQMWRTSCSPGSGWSRC